MCIGNSISYARPGHVHRKSEFLCRRRWVRADRPECFDLAGDRSASNQQVGHDPLVDVQVALVFTEVAELVALRQHAPNRGAKS